MIRLATEQDIPQCVEMGLRFHAESTYGAKLTANPEQMHKAAAFVLASDGLLVCEREGRLTGMLGYVTYPNLLSAEMIAGELFWWVSPDHRGDGLRLLKEAERRAKARGAVKMQMIAPNERVRQLYEHLGYEFLESTFQRAL